MKDCKDPSLSSELDEMWKKAYDEGRLHLLDGRLYYRTKDTCVMKLTDRALINYILHELHHRVASGHLLKDRTVERIKTCTWWPNWRTNVAEYFQTWERLQKENKDIGKTFEVMIQIKNQSTHGK
ncbi:hypothetical protein O181_047051 [Austropuccinia psidii MF-1]|uniref:Integrase zinc-binding domain-containing protein n=1 Tax=Austropuccinia psidii MF-1 TaxID=1389203 RepID=A0A9Q3DVD7_9BASI|nr:hypothetical protein [Austropuccinia psidii MF-1]